jgi:4-hydroxythreonine-4-phosphate dehydrogenase
VADSTSSGRAEQTVRAERSNPSVRPERSGAKRRGVEGRGLEGRPSTRARRSTVRPGGAVVSPAAAKTTRAEPGTRRRRARAAAPGPRIAISLGDPSGVGPEVTAKALVALAGALSPIVFGDARVLERDLGDLGLPLLAPGDPVPPGGARIAVTRLPKAAIRPGRPAPEAGAAQLAYLDAAFECVRRGDAAALCTAPVSKAQVARALPGFVGHTEWLEARCGVRRSVMMLAGERLKIALVTNHVAFTGLRRALTEARIVETLAITHRALRDDLGLPRPRLALAALNPHAGEQGQFGDEEDRLLRPALAAAARAGAPAEGPFPADSVFFRAALGEFDAVVALYHDQGLIPVKLLDAVGGDPAVNVTLGLPIVRTSPDHGVAYDIAGEGVASGASMIAAVKLAVRIAAVRAGRAERR